VKVQGSSSSGLVFARVVDGGIDLARARLEDGSVRALLETPDRSEVWPYWSELARRLAFEVDSIGRGPSDLRLWLPNSGEEVPFTDTTGRREGWAVWSSTAPELAFAFVGPGNRSGVAIADLSQGRARIVASAGRDDFFLRPTFSPDGSRMVAQRRGPGGRGSNLWILTRDAPPQRVTHDPEWFDFKAWFTRSGERILYSRRPLGGGWHEIASVTPDGKDLRLHAHVPETDAHSARPSPVRDEFAFVSNRENEVFDLYLESIAGEDLRNLSNSASENEFAPRWSPDGERVVVTVAEEQFGMPRLDDLEGLGQARIRVLDRDGRVLFAGRRLHQRRRQRDRREQHRQQPEHGPLRAGVKPLLLATAAMEHRVEAVSRQAGNPVECALDPPERILSQREVMVRGHLVTDVLQQAAKRAERKLVEMPWEVEMEPGRAAPARLGALEVGYRHDQAAPRRENPMHLLEHSPRIREVLEHVPDHDLVEEAVGVSGVRELWGDPDLRAHVGTARGLGAHLDAVHFETAIGERSEDHAAATAHVQHPGLLRKAPREERDVARADRAHQSLDEGMELHAGLAVVLVRIEGAHLVDAEHRLEAPEPAVGADDDRRRHPVHGEARTRPGGTAHRTGRDVRRIRFPEIPHRTRVQVRACNGGRRGRHGSDGACAPAAEWSSRASARRT
jgi:Tol biopolymer transport system component